MKRITAILLSFIIFAGLVPSSLAQSNDYYIYVSPSGDDSAPGTKEKPLATLNGAKIAVRKARNSIEEGNIVVTFEPGRYEFDSTVVFENIDSGNDRVKITYRAEKPDTVSFVGSKIIDTSDFEPVTDPSVRARLQEDVRNKIGQLDLKKSGINEIVNYLRPPHYYGEVGLPIYKLYLDNSEQMMSRYPNEEYARTGKIINPGTVKNPGISIDTTAEPIIFQTNLERASKWATAPDAMIEGFFKYDWAYDVLYLDTVNENNEVITKNSTTALGIQSNMRYAVMNLMEEIDIPGEYYIDRENLILYYYPPYPITSDMQMEISLMTEDMIHLSEVSNITFERLSFEKTRGSGIIIENSENVSILGCKFQNIGKSAVQAEGHDIEIRSNNFSYIGGDCITIDGGNRTTLIPSNNRVVNNHIYRYSLVGKTYTNGVEIYGCGNIVENNLIHNAPHQGIWFEGNDNKIRYNEINDALKSSADAGVIYAGRDQVSRGNEISYNYIHNANYTEYLHGRVADAYTLQDFGIYMDDNFSGTWAHHNVIADAVTGMIYGNGSDLKIHDNIIYNAIQAWKVGNDETLTQAQWVASVLPGGEVYNKAVKQPFRGRVWQSHYPELKNYFLTTPNLQYPRNCVVYDNLAYQTDEFYIEPVEGKAMSEAALQVENNIVIKNEDIFVDVENQDFAIKDEKILENMPGLAEIDMSKIGLFVDEYRTEIELKDTSFKKISPKINYTGVDNLSSFFMWEDFVGADRYRLTIAKDPEFKEIVFDEETRYNYCTVEGLESRKTDYYWDVTAYVNVRQMQAEYKAEGGAYKFTTTLYEKVDKTTFEDLFISAKEKLSQIVEGAKPGEYPVGTKEKYKDVVERATELDNNPHPYQSEIDAMCDEFETASKNLSAVRNKGYKNLSDMLDSNWVTEAGTVSVEGNNITLTGSGTGAGTYDINPDVYELLNFKMQADFSDGLVGLAARQSHPEVIIWNRTKGNERNDGYYVVIKSDVIELQRFIASDSDAMIKVVPNTFIEANKEYDIVFGAVDVEGGVRIILRCNGETIFDEIDSSNPVYDKGAFSISNSSANGYIRVSAVTELPSGDIFDTTGTYKENREQTLSVLLNKAKEKLSQIVEGETPGAYAVGTKEEYQKVIDAAEAVKNPTDLTLDEFNSLIAQLKAAGRRVDGNVIKGYKNFADLLSGKWVNGTNIVAVDNEAITLSSNTSSAGTYDVAVESYEILNFNMKFNLSDGWVGIAARQTHPETLIWERTAENKTNNGYFIVIKPEQIELQRFIDSNSDAMIKVIPNTFFKNDTEYNVEFGAINVEDGVRILLKCNGMTVFDEIDNEEPIYEKGCFAICNASKKGFIKLSKVSELPEGSVAE